VRINSLSRGIGNTATAAQWAHEILRNLEEDITLSTLLTIVTDTAKAQSLPSAEIMQPRSHPTRCSLEVKRVERQKGLSSVAGATDPVALRYPNRPPTVPLLQHAATRGSLSSTISS
jgi:hypothetical protein